MMMTATLTLLAGLCVLLFIAAASYLSRGALRRGLVVITLAIGLSAATAFSIYPALRLTNGGTDDAFRIAELEQLRADRDQLLIEVGQKSRDNEALSKTSAFFTKLHKERMTRISDDIHNIKEILLGPGSGMQVGLDRADLMLSSFLDGPSGFDSILADLRQLKTLRVRSPNEQTPPILAMLGQTRATDTGTTGMIVEMPTATVNLSQPVLEASTLAEPDTLAVLRKALDGKMATGAYKVEALTEPELVMGRRGKYYVIELKNSNSGDRFTFDSGKYTFQSSRGAFKASFHSFAADVLKQLEGRAKFSLYVRGSADAQAYTGALEPGFEYRSLSYLPSSRGKYLANLATAPVPQIVRNAELPNLRGEYLRKYLGELYPSAPISLLEGTVTKKDNPAARNTELILFVGW